MRTLLHRIRRHKLMTLAVLALLGLFAATAGTATGLALEEHDEFCASCHTQPEYDYWMRSQTIARSPHDVADLAAFHMVPAASSKNPSRMPVKCIDCHGGTAPTDRLSTVVTIGVIDTVKFVALPIKQPAKLSQPLPNSFCTGCHQADIDRPGFDNHFHNKQSDLKAPPANCTSCHLAHAEADSLNTFVLRQAAYPSCNACHKLMGGPTNLR